MDIINIILTLAAAFNLGLGFYIYLQQKKNPINISFTLIALSNFFWTIAMIAFRWSQTQELALWWCRLLYFFPLFIAATFLHFSFVFRGQKRRLRKKELYFLYLLTFSIGALVFVPGVIIERIFFRPGLEKAIIFGTGYFVYFLYYFVYFSWAFLNLLRRLNCANFLVRNQARWIILGTFLPVSFGLVTNLILPWGYIFALNWFAQVGSILFVGGIAYAIVKYQLLNLRLIVAQILSIFLVSVLFLNIFYFDNFWRLILNLAIFLLGISFSAILIRSVVREIEQKEKIQNLANELKSANEELKKLDEVKSEFVSIASHQLRTPLSVIKGYAAMLLEEMKESEEKEAINKIYLSNERLIKLVNDLLNLSRIERGKLQFEFRKTQLADVIESVISEFQMLARRRGLKLNYEKVHLPLVKIDADKLRQVFVNIIDNAIKYTLHGGITIKTLLEDDAIVISIRDTGVGMRKEDLGAIYEKFQRGRAGSEIHPNGAGIGLYIANEIIKAHKGRMWAESSGLNQGTCFYLKLPLE